jgi:hydroxymethylglutaryl-CoA lyase
MAGMKIIECPRDAMQGRSEFVPTGLKVDYINKLLKVGFDTIDFGSFVSPRAIPQMRDTAEVLEQLDLVGSKSKLLAIVANTRGAQDACNFEEIEYLGFPLSVSETFQLRNTNKSIDQALETVAEIQELALKSSKKQVVYLSMGFGNPYGDPYSEEVLSDFTRRLQQLGVDIISLADTIGTSKPDQIKRLFSQLQEEYPLVQFGAHLHSTPDTAVEKIQAVIESGCERIDGALMGFGGCPMAKDDLTGNVDTQLILNELNGQVEINTEALSEAKLIAQTIFA